MLDYSNPFLQSLGNVRAQPQQNQFMQPQNQYDFSGWGDRLGKIEQGIAGLTDQFNNFQKPGDVAPEYTGNAAPEPLGQTANAPEPLGGIESLVEEPWQQGNMTSMGHTQPSPPGGASFTLGSGDPRDAYMESIGAQGTPTNVLESMGVHGMGAAPQNAGFNFDPQGITTDQWGNERTGNLQAQLAQAYGGQTNVEGQMGRPQGFTQGFSDFFTGEGYYADPRGTWVDGPWGISDKPIDVGPRMGGTLDPYGNPGGGPSSWEGTFAGTPPGWTGQPQNWGWNKRAGMAPATENDIQEGQRLGSLGIGIGPTTRQPVDPNALAVQYQQNQGYQPGVQQEFIKPYNDPSLMAAGIAGQPSGHVPSLRGPTQQRIQQGLGTLV